MAAFIQYFIGVNLLLLLQAVYFRVFLARQRRFQWNRIYLVGGLGVALLLPLLRWEIVPPTLPNPSFVQALPEMVIDVAPVPVVSQPSTVPALVATSIPAPAAPAWSPSALEIGLAIYLIGVTVALIALLWRNMMVIRLIANGRKSPQDGYTLVTTTQDIGPASYFRYIFWNAAHDLDPKCAAVALAHERCHSRQLHSLDLIALELLKAFCWINPAIYMLRRDLRQTHEYLADQAALPVAGVDGIKRLLLQQQLGTHELSITNSFYSHIKERIMVLSENSKRKTILQYLCVLPLAALMAGCTSFAHQTDGQTNSFVVDSPATTAANVAENAQSQDSADVGSQADAQATAGFFDLDDMLIRNQLPPVSDNPSKKGIVCLGRQPQVLNLDTILSIEELENVDNHPHLLNRDRVMKMIGLPVDAKGKAIKGKVVVKLLVDDTGRVIRHQYIGSNIAVLRDAVEAHVKELLFKPGLENGLPSEWWVIMPFNFGMPGC